MIKKLFTAILAAFLAISAPFIVSAEEYSREYPDIFNSGSPLWLHCEISGMGEYLIVIDPNTNLQSFGFDSPKGYNLINNTGTAIYGRAYNMNSNEGYSAVWYSYYCLSLKTGKNAAGAYTSYEPYTITKIYGTTLDLIDYVGDRGNDYYDGLTIDNRQLILVIISAGVIVTLLNFFLFRRGHR